MRTASATGAVLAFVLLAAPGAARAQTPATADGFALDRFRPAERGGEWFFMDSLDLRGHLRPSFGLVAYYGYRPLAAYRADGDVRFAPVEHQLMLHPGASLRLWDRLRLGLDVPIAVLNSGEAGTLNGTPVPPANGAGLGDVRLTFDLRVVGKYREAFTLAFGMQTFLPSGARAGYLSDGSVRVQPRVQMAGDLGRFAYAVNAGLLGRAAQVFAGYDIGTDFTFGASFGVRLLAKRQLLLGPEVYGGTSIGTPPAIRSTPLEGLFGAHLTLSDEWRIGAGGGLGLSRAFGSPAARVFLGLEWTPRVEEAATKPEAAAPAVTAASADRDSDGVLDDADACPDAKGERTLDASTNGCPLDKDGDGILDEADACPDVKGVATEDPKTRGCPPDKDGDGVLDDADACPDVKGVATEDPKTRGCPPPADRDHDTILDNQDACPDEAGSANTDPLKNGCPQATIQGGEIKVVGEVKFATASAKILPESEEVLASVLEVLQKHAEIAKVRVEGHTDDKGSAAGNRKLSQGRAESVVAWLIAKGVVKGRLSAKGFGPDKPIADNKTDDGRRQNRRVVFRIEAGAGDALAK